MTEEQTERLVCAFEKMAKSLDYMADATGDVANAISGSYDGQTKSAFYGMMQALFMMVDADGKGQALHVVQQKDKR